MNTKSKMQVLLAALIAMPAGWAVSAVCKQGVLDGNRALISTCSDSTCASYAVGSDGTTNLGFGDITPDAIYFEFYSPDAKPPATGTFDLGSGNNSNYASCQQCILVYQDLIDPLDPQKIFFQAAGTLAIDPGTVPGADVIGLTWSNVSLVEVTIDPDTFISTPVPGGDCYTIVADELFHDGFQAP